MGSSISGISAAEGDQGAAPNFLGNAWPVTQRGRTSHLTGPSLADVWQRKAGTAQGFLRYSEAIKKSGITWNEGTLDAWLASPVRLVPGGALPECYSFRMTKTRKIAIAVGVALIAVSGIAAAACWLCA